MGFISCHITSLVIHSLEGEHTHTDTDIHTETILRNHAAGAPGLKVAKVGKSIIYILMLLFLMFSLLFIVATNVLACDNFLVAI